MSGKEVVKPTLEMVTATKAGTILEHSYRVTHKEMQQETKLFRAMDKNFEK